MRAWLRFCSPPSQNRNFVPDWTFKGPSLAAFRTLCAAEWRAIHPVSQSGYTVSTQHGIGAGDINGDKRLDILSPYGWWGSRPRERAKARGPAIRSRSADGDARAGPGGAELSVFDVNGDGLNDMVTVVEAHGWGMFWFEQKRDKSGVSFSQAHAKSIADIDGDRVPASPNRLRRRQRKRQTAASSTPGMAIGAPSGVSEP